jgi:hypothetical protein
MDPSVVQQLVEEITKKTLEALAHSADSNMSETGDLPQDTVEDQTDPSWREIIQGKAVTPNTTEAQRFLQLLSKAPPLQDRKMQAQSVFFYSGVPETPPPRRNKVDLSLYTVPPQDGSCHAPTSTVHGHQSSYIYGSGCCLDQKRLGRFTATKAFLHGRTTSLEVGPAV